ncbi:MAG: hypothetical protein ACXVEF_18440 [Polyangiales bacterium]
MAARKRTERRALDRAVKKDIERRDKLATLEAGGAPDRPLEVTSASLVEPAAKALHCARCGAELRVDEHAARTIEGTPLRVVSLSCVSCGGKRTVYVKIAMLN